MLIHQLQFFTDYIPHGAYKCGKRLAVDMCEVIMGLMVVAFVWYFFGPMMAFGMFAIACFFAAINNQQQHKCPERVYVPSPVDDREYEHLWE